MGTDLPKTRARLPRRHLHRPPSSQTRHRQMDDLRHPANPGHLVFEPDHNLSYRK